MNMCKGIIMLAVLGFLMGFIYSFNIYSVGRPVDQAHVKYYLLGKKIILSSNELIYKFSNKSFYKLNSLKYYL